MPPGLKSHPQRRTVISSTSESQDPKSQIVQLCTEGGNLSLKKHLHVSTFCFLNHVIMNILAHTPCAPGHAWPVQTEKPALGNSTRSSAFPSSPGRLMWWCWFFFWVENFETQRCEGMGQIVFPKWPQFLPAHVLFPMGPDCTPQKRWNPIPLLGYGLVSVTLWTYRKWHKW